jgi:hypothetical protein
VNFNGAVRYVQLTGHLFIGKTTSHKEGNFKLPTAQPARPSGLISRFTRLAGHSICRRIIQRIEPRSGDSPKRSAGDYAAIADLWTATLCLVERGGSRSLQGDTKRADLHFALERLDCRALKS